MAAAIGYAKKHGMQWATPENTYEVPEFHSYFPHLPVTNQSPGERYLQHDPKDFAYKEIPYFPYGVTLVGFFQSLKWFENAQEEVRQAFKLPRIPGYEDYVSIHVRRGDFVEHSNSFPPVTLAYIKEAINKTGILTKGVIEGFMVFSDDIQWCKEQLTGSSFKFSEGRTPFEDLSLMASCGHHIMANSTFSWWGAYLGHNPNKIIVCPSHDNFFGPAGPKETKDLIPPGWHQIKFR